MSDEVPVFAVVGRVNKGKSSVVATLAEDPSVAIAPRPGTTRICTRFPVEVDGEVLFELVDTPGFEEADRALAWLEKGGGVDRPARVRAFLRHFMGTDDFVEERTLLTPIMDGASILYVVDGAHPFRANHRAEMEVLRWTGRPGMALVNRIGEGDHTAEWQAALTEVFEVVRGFDAHTAGFADRIALLRDFRRLDPQAAPALDRAIAAMVADRDRRRAEAALVLTDLLVDACTLTITEAAPDAEEIERRRAELEARFHDRLRALEQQARRRVEKLYHHDVRWAEGELARPVFDEDLFAERTWDALGLTDGQLLAITAGAGAVTGGAIDAAVGGASFLAGTAIGAAVGLIGGLTRIGRRYAEAGPVERVRKLGRQLGGEGGKPWRVGPHQNPNFAFVLLDRALLHYGSVAQRAHARQDRPALESAERPSATMPAEARRAFGGLFERLRREHADVDRETRERLHARIAAQLDALDPAAAVRAAPDA